MPQERRLAMEFSGVKIEEELLPINPAAHYSMGGIKTDINSSTNINSLYACGEVAQSSIHGANRLGGNSLLEIVTFGKVAGINASNNAKEIKTSTAVESNELSVQKKHIKDLYSYTNELNFYESKEYLGKLFFDNVGLFRNEENLLFAIKELEDIKSKIPYMGIVDKSIEYNKNLVEFLEFINMIEIAEVIARTALSRKESRGAHYRNDYPQESKTYEKNSIIKKVNDDLVLSFEDVE